MRSVIGNKISPENKNLEFALEVCDFFSLLRLNDVCDFYKLEFACICLDASIGVFDDARGNGKQRVVFSFSDVESRANG